MHEQDSTRYSTQAQTRGGPQIKIPGNRSLLHSMNSHWCPCKSLQVDYKLQPQESVVWEAGDGGSGNMKAGGGRRRGGGACRSTTSFSQAR